MGLVQNDANRTVRNDDGVTALLRRNQELEATVAVLVDLLVDAGVVDRHVLELRVEARMEEMSEAS